MQQVISSYYALDLCTAIHLLPIDLSQDTVDLVSTGHSSIFPSSMSLSNQSIVIQNYIENKDLVSTVNFHVQSLGILGKVLITS